MLAPADTTAARLCAASKRVRRWTGAATGRPLASESISLCHNLMLTKFQLHRRHVKYGQPGQPRIRDPPSASARFDHPALDHAQYPPRCPQTYRQPHREHHQVVSVRANRAEHPACGSDQRASESAALHVLKAQGRATGDFSTVTGRRGQPLYKLYGGAVHLKIEELESRRVQVYVLSHGDDCVSSQEAGPFL